MEGEIASISFDDAGRLRILDADRYEASQALQDNCARFVDSMRQLQDGAGRYLAAAEQQAARVEREKLRAVGLRTRVAALHDERRRRAAALRQALAERAAELERLLAEEASLERARAEQEAMLARLADAAGSGGGGGSVGGW